MQTARDLRNLFWWLHACQRSIRRSAYDAEQTGALDHDLSASQGAIAPANADNSPEALPRKRPRSAALPLIVETTNRRVRHHWTMSRRGTPTPGELGLPEHSALTVEGRIERASMVGTHLARRRYRQERPLRRSGWAQGLGLLMAALGVMVVLFVVLYLVS